ncbi:MAG TPA: PTPA-CTERM sorting domain-containing protein [Leptolyngbyaceae cyanobacterium]
MIPSRAAHSTSTNIAANHQSSPINNTPDPIAAETIGQTFTVENSSVVKSFSIGLRTISTTADPVTLVAYVMEWNGTGVQGEILYRSAPKVKAAGSGVEQFDFDVNNTQPILTPGKQYVAFVTTVGTGKGSSEITTGSSLSDVYSEGRFVSKSGDFQSGKWNAYDNGDVPFKILFAAAPADEQQQPGGAAGNPGDATLKAIGTVAAVGALLADKGEQQSTKGNNQSQSEGTREQPSEEKNQPQNQPQPVPTPALLPGLIGLSVSVLRKRNLEKKKASE